MAMKSCVTVSLVAEARGGPFVFWDDLPAACEQAARLGFDAVEVFVPSPDTVNPAELQRLLHVHHLALAAVIIGSMQGRWGDGLDKATALEYLTQALNSLGDHARRHGVPLVYEPLNRYETNLVNTAEEGVRLLESLATSNVVLLADLFHMNIEETDLAAALRTGGCHIGHVHFVDSNRRPAGRGHLDFGPIVAALRDIGYQGYLSAEALPYPTPWEAAQQTIATYRRLIPGSY